ncbi:MAG: hypothetical protein M3R15_13500 [Acidobacteriota bacterium]|nr:hypothetical protein [Acidobacteriota bacterium]
MDIHSVVVKKAARLLDLRERRDAEFRRAVRDQRHCLDWLSIRDGRLRLARLVMLDLPFRVAPRLDRKLDRRACRVKGYSPTDLLTTPSAPLRP